MKESEREIILMDCRFFRLDEIEFWNSVEEGIGARYHFKKVNDFGK
jgi:hypothetical protein